MFTEIDYKIAEARCRLSKTKKDSKCYKDTLKWLRRLENERSKQYAKF